MLWIFFYQKIYQINIKNLCYRSYITNYKFIVLIGYFFFFYF